MQDGRSLNVVGGHALDMRPTQNTPQEEEEEDSLGGQKIDGNYSLHLEFMTVNQGNKLI